jgi:ABC-type transport system involved in multi-copper enzyme maturation permease subunit
MLRAKLRSAGPWIGGLLLTLAGAVRASGHGAGAETFTNLGFLCLIALAFDLGAGILSEEIESGHAQLVLLRPITRAAWYGGRLWGACLAFAIFCTVAWLATFAAAVHRGDGFDPMRLLALLVALVWGWAWLSVLTCLGAFLSRWTNAGAVAAAMLLWIFSMGLAAGLHSEWLEHLQTVGKYLGPQDPLAVLDRTKPGRDFGPALYDLLWIFAPWLAGVAILNRRELARRRP